MVVYIVKCKEHIHGVYNSEPIAEFVKNNQNIQLPAESPKYIVEAFKINDF